MQNQDIAAHGINSCGNQRAHPIPLSAILAFFKPVQKETFHNWFQQMKLRISTSDAGSIAASALCRFSGRRQRVGCPRRRHRVRFPRFAGNAEVGVRREGAAGRPVVGSPSHFFLSLPSNRIEDGRWNRAIYICQRHTEETETETRSKRIETTIHPSIYLTTRNRSSPGTLFPGTSSTA